MTLEYLLMTYSGPELLDLARKGLLCIDAYDVSKIVCAATEQFLDMEADMQNTIDDLRKQIDNLEDIISQAQSVLAG